jgi:hypothetical protein
MKVINEKKQFLLANEEMLVDFVNNNEGVPPPPPTGGQDPTCPAVRKSGGLFT